MEDYELHICDHEMRQKRNFFFEDSHAFSSGATAFFICIFELNDLKNVAYIQKWCLFFSILQNNI